MVLLFVAQALACPSLSDAVERMTQAVVTGADPAAPRADISASLQCAPASPSLLAKWYLAEGAAAYLNQDPASTRWFVASRRLSPDYFDERYGDLVHKAWETATAEGRATLTVDLAASVDGKPVDTWPFSLEAGPAVVQVIGRDGSVRFFRAVDLAPGDEALLPTLLGPEQVVKKKKSPALLIAGGAAAVAAGVLGGLSFGVDNEIPTATTPTELSEMETRQKGLAYSAYGLGALAVTGVTLHFVLP